jgi:uncharacterized membrane protein
VAVKTKLVNFLDILHSNFWFVPALLAVAAWLLSSVTLTADLTFRAKTLEIFGYSRGPDGARMLLATVAGSVIGIAGVSFSITIAALSLASSQLGPRLLRTFIRDVGNQLVLGTQLATFLYCLLILRTINGIGDEDFVPHLSVVTSLILAVVSLAVFIYFIDHISSSVQADHVAAVVNQELEAVINRAFPAQTTFDTPECRMACIDEQDIAMQLKGCSASIGSAKSGYLRAIDMRALVRVATKCDALLCLERRPGDFVVQGSTLAWSSSKKQDQELLEREVNRACLFGRQRTSVEDVEFVIHQLVEIAVRALSPGTNDPFTAITCIDWLGRASCQITERTFPSPYHYDGSQTLRVISQPETFERLFDAVFSQIREAAHTNTLVTLHLLETSFICWKP